MPLANARSIAAPIFVESGTNSPPISWLRWAQSIFQFLVRLVLLPWLNLLCTRAPTISKPILLTDHGDQGCRLTNSSRPSMYSVHHHESTNYQLSTRGGFLANSRGLSYSRVMVDIAYQRLPSHRKTICRISLVLLLMVAINSLGDSVFNSYAYAAKQGRSCTKVGFRNGSVICTRVKGKLIWQPIKKHQTLFVDSPTKVSFASKTIFIDYSSSSGLLVQAISASPKICTLDNKTLQLVSPGYCVIQLNQPGDSRFLSAGAKEIKILIQGTNEISFSSSRSLLVSTKTYPLSGTSTSGLPLTYESLTPDICSVSETILILTKIGICTVQASQNGSDLYEPAQPVEVSITISDARVTSDQIDAVTGFQIKAIYVVPSDGVDHSYDTNGYIAGILDEGNQYLHAQLGYRVPVDKNAVGYDIQYLKSTLSTAYLQTADDLTSKLLAESMALENPGVNRKDYIFFIDVDAGLKGTDIGGAGLAPAVCGYGRQPGMSAVAAVGRRCTSKENSFDNSATRTWVHEMFHNFGIDHSLDTPCDLMSTGITTCPSGGTITVDRERSRYVGSSLQGQDILKLRVWEGYTDRQDLQANCYLNPTPRADGINYAYCATGTQSIGALKYCWTFIHSVTLEEFVDGQWKDLGPGNSYSDPWGPNVIWKCTAGSAPWKQLTVTTPGISLYRWIINGNESEQFKVIWVR